MGDVKILRLPFPSENIQFTAFEGNQILDLNGTTRGAIRQDFLTSAGQDYVLTFAYANNPSANGVSNADVFLSDVVSSATLLNEPIPHGNSTNLNAQYIRFEGFFTAVGPLTRLEFVSTSPDGSPNGGILIDDVSVVPEPPAALLVLIALTYISPRSRLRWNVTLTASPK
jgi:hypothetical protein